MRTPQYSATAIIDLFRQQTVASLPDVMAALGTRARRTAFRKLKELPYRILAGPLTTMDNRAALYRVVNHLSELELYVTTTEALADALTAVGRRPAHRLLGIDAGTVARGRRQLIAGGLARVRGAARPHPRDGRAPATPELPARRAQGRARHGQRHDWGEPSLPGRRDAQLRPVAATLLSVNRERFNAPDRS